MLKVLAGQLQNWRITLQIENGCSLREVTKTGSIKATMRPSCTNLRLKILQRAAKLRQIAELSGHPFRVGGAVDLLEERKSLKTITPRGGWKTKSIALECFRNCQSFP